ncbi:MAG: type II toxin-antitoxin system RelE/ParE family toxin [Terracidiphilus sp.]
MRKIWIRPRALQDLLETGSYLSIEAGESVADRFQDAVEETAQVLLGMPGMGTVCTFHHPRLKEIRRVPVTGFENWLVFYQVRNSDIDVIRVLHGARDIAAIFEEDAHSL